ncbi:MAG: glycosyltransferase family protein [Proteobacteria bacterium]|nr:glycosyltransferase family protein [Pseudomonadota bacterium]
MTTVAIVQARMGSSRLPGKVLATIAGASMLARVVTRLRAARSIDAIVIATTTADLDDAVAREARRLGVGVFRGSETDVLARYVGAARMAKADVVVRVTSDCPLLDPHVVDAVVALLDRPTDYASNTHVRSFPRGLDVEALHRDVLERIDRLATSPAAREHVTAFILEEPARFVVRQLVADRDDSDLRWTVDTDDDLAVVRALAQIDAPYGLRAEVARREPALHANAHVVQKATFA